MVYLIWGPIITVELIFAACSDTCVFANDGACDDGRPGAPFSLCDFGTDCNDCEGNG